MNNIVQRCALILTARGISAAASFRSEISSTHVGRGSIVSHCLSVPRTYYSGPPVRPAAIWTWQAPPFARYSIYVGSSWSEYRLWHRRLGDGDCPTVNISDRYGNAYTKAAGDVDDSVEKHGTSKFEEYRGIERNGKERTAVEIGDCGIGRFLSQTVVKSRSD